MKKTISIYGNYLSLSDCKAEEDCTEVDLLKDQISKLQDKHFTIAGQGLEYSELDRAATP